MKETLKSHDSENELSKELQPQKLGKEYETLRFGRESSVLDSEIVESCTSQEQEKRYMYASATQNMS